jgi:hypothetical protein
LGSRTMTALGAGTYLTLLSATRVYAGVRDFVD